MVQGEAFRCLAVFVFWFRLVPYLVILSTTFQGAHHKGYRNGYHNNAPRDEQHEQDLRAQQERGGRVPHGAPASLPYGELALQHAHVQVLRGGPAPHDGLAPHGGQVLHGAQAPQRGAQVLSNEQAHQRGVQVQGGGLAHQHALGYQRGELRDDLELQCGEQELRDEPALMERNAVPLHDIRRVRGGLERDELALAHGVAARARGPSVSRRDGLERLRGALVIQRDVLGRDDARVRQHGATLALHGGSRCDAPQHGEHLDDVRGPLHGEQELDGALERPHDGGLALRGGSPRGALPHGGYLGDVEPLGGHAL